MSGNLLRKLWITPITAALFLAQAVTGLLMLAGVRSHDLGEAHEGIGIAFAIFGVLHLVKNWRALGSYFKAK